MASQVQVQTSYRALESFHYNKPEPSGYIVKGPNCVETTQYCPEIILTIEIEDDQVPVRAYPVYQLANVMWLPYLRISWWAVVLAQLAEQSIPIPEVHSSNPVIGNFL